MRQAILYGAGDLRLEEVDLKPDRLQPNEMYVETLVSALSTGTDLGNYLGDSEYVPGAPAYPRPVGYSNVGRIAQIGQGVDGWQVGQRVFSNRPHQSAYLASQSEMMVSVPEKASSEQASLVYLAQLGLAALRQAHYQAGEQVAVIGLGVIGLCTVAVARMLGAQVIAVANSPQRAKAASQMGAHQTLMAEEIPTNAPGSADVVVLTANSWLAYRLAVAMARHGGRVSILGFPGRGQAAPEFNPLDPKWLYAKQLSLIGAGYSPRLECDPRELRFNLRRNLVCLLERMADGGLALEPIISHRFPADRMQEAYELARKHDKNLLAAVFLWQGPA